MKGIIYVMTTAVSGLVKIGRTGTDNYTERMRNLEANGYYNVVGLGRFLAIELEDYKEKEVLLHDIFAKHRVGDSELFALDKDLLQRLLLSFEGKFIYPKNINQEEVFEAVTKINQKSKLFSFYKKGLNNGDIITFRDDPNITAKIVGSREVEYNNKIWKLSPLLIKLYKDRGTYNGTRGYHGAQHFKYNNIILMNLPDKDED